MLKVNSEILAGKGRKSAGSSPIQEERIEKSWREEYQSNGEGGTDDVKAHENTWPTYPRFISGVVAIPN